ncbi:gephyrin-like molybdotransferase Glp [Desulfitobacterium sp. THU1]|uniref:molybdopterin molybdotransferase MoeA n=1 Tax=Desulfitobacterium sp. THU1 TaxID=3138072 RepID=UPI0031202386
METMISLERALDIIFEQVKPLGTEKIHLAQSYGRVSAKDIEAAIDMPPFDRSPLDGYTYYAQPSDPSPLTLQVVSEIPAGNWPERELKLGECARIFTGAPIPQGANCVVRQEDTEPLGDRVQINLPVRPGANVVYCGEETRKGDIVLATGELLSPAAVGLLASLGVEEVEVYRSPKVGILSTGSELREVGDPLTPGKIYNSNTYTLQGLLLEAGCQVKVAPFVADDLGETVAALRALEDMDFVVTTGGASVGDYDLIRDALEEVGCKLLFWKVNFKPGTPVAVGIKGDMLYFSLSGNPAAAVVNFELLVRPALRKLKGRKLPERTFPVYMDGDFGKSGKQRRFIRARAVFRNGEIWADPSFAQGSSVLRSMKGSHLLIDVPGGHGPVQKGERLQGRWISSWEED